MGNFTQLFLLSFLIVGFFLIWIVTGIYISIANHDLKQYRKSDDDPDLNNAAWYTFWATFTTWSVVALAIVIAIIGVVVGIGSAIFFAPEEAVASVGAAATAAGETALEYGAVAKKHSSKIAKFAKIGFWIVLVFLLGMCTLNGILALLALNSMLKSPNWSYQNNDLEQARKDTLFTALVSIGGVLAILTFLLSYFISKNIRKHRVNKQVQKQ
jgi:flagellar biosynthesis protein FlhB